MTIPERTICEHELHAYVDGRLWPEREREVEQCLRTQPYLARLAADYRAQRAGLRAALAQEIDAPIPPELDLARLLEARLGHCHPARRTAIGRR
jgi:anti-sigma factor RsiW